MTGTARIATTTATARTPAGLAGLAGAECAAAADPDGGRGYEAAVRRQAQVKPRPVLRLEGGQGLASYVNERIAERDQAEAGG